MSLKRSAVIPCQDWTKCTVLRSAQQMDPLVFPSRLYFADLADEKGSESPSVISFASSITFTTSSFLTSRLPRGISDTDNMHF